MAVAGHTNSASCQVVIRWNGSTYCNGRGVALWDIDTLGRDILDT